MLMTDATANIEERRLALLELNSLAISIKVQYGDDPPMEIRKTLSELATLYRKKYGSNAALKTFVR